MADTSTRKAKDRLLAVATGRHGGQLVSPVGYTFAGLVQRFGKATAVDLTHFSLMNSERVMKTVKDNGPGMQTDDGIRNLTKVMALETHQSVWREWLSSMEDLLEAFPEHEHLQIVCGQISLVTVRIPRFGLYLRSGD